MVSTQNYVRKCKSAETEQSELSAGSIFNKIYTFFNSFYNLNDSSYKITITGEVDPSSHQFAS